MSRVSASKPVEEVERWELKRDALLTATPAQIDTWVDNNVTNLADARVMFRRIIKMLRVLARDSAG